MVTLLKCEIEQVEKVQRCFTKRLKGLKTSSYSDATNLCVVIVILFLILAFILTEYVNIMYDSLLFWCKLLVHARALLSCYHVTIVSTVCMFSE